MPRIDLTIYGENDKASRTAIRWRERAGMDDPALVRTRIDRIRRRRAGRD